MVPQVQVVAILMIVHGVLVTLMGFFYALMGPFMFAMFTMGPSSGAKSGGPGTTEASIISGIYVLIGLPVLAVGLLNIVAGTRCLRFRGRVFAIVALFCNIIPLFTCYCMPTSLGVMIYGLIVLFQPDVTAAFVAVAAGVPPERVKQRARHPEDDFDDEPTPRPRPLAPRSTSENIQRRPDEYQ